MWMRTHFSGAQTLNIFQCSIFSCDFINMFMVCVCEYSTHNSYTIWLVKQNKLKKKANQCIMCMVQITLNHMWKEKCVEKTAKIVLYFNIPYTLHSYAHLSANYIFTIYLDELGPRFMAYEAFISTVSSFLPCVIIHHQLLTFPLLSQVERREKKKLKQLSASC